MIILNCTIFLVMQIIANLLFKWGGSASHLYWWGFILGNIVGVSSILFMIAMYRDMPAPLVIAIGTGGTYLLNQIAMYCIYRDKLSPFAWAGLLLIFIGILMTALLNHPGQEKAAAVDSSAKAGCETAVRNDLADMNLDLYLPAFYYGDQKVQLSTWKNEKISDAVTVYHSPDGLLDVKITRKKYDGYPVLEYLPELIAVGKTSTPQIRDFQSFHAMFELRNAECRIRSVHGAETNPLDFSARTHILALRENDNELTMETHDGKSSDSYMPWFGIDMDYLHGFELAIGWTGDWKASFRISDGSVEAACGMKRTDFYLNPGESVRQPAIMLFVRDGQAVSDFLPVIRRFMVNHKSPRDSKGNIMMPRLCCTFSGGNRSIASHLKTIDYAVAQKLPFDTFWMDAGWNGPRHIPNQTTNCGDCWGVYVGDWRVNTGVYPDGSLRVVSDYLHRHGYDFLLWIEPERVVSQTPIAQEHPEYLLKLKDDSGLYSMLLDLGNQDAWNWIFKTVSQIIRDNGVDVYRQDFNIPPAPYWSQYDDPQRIGIREIRHIEGLYRYLDALRKEFPDMLLENCSSGGRRMDFEMVSRAHSYCRSDYIIPRFSPESQKHEFQILMGQNAIMNLSPYIPFHGGEFNCAENFNDYDAFSVGLPTCVFTPADRNNIIVEHEVPEEETTWYKRMIGIFDRARKIMRYDLYPLTEPSTLDQSIWCAWQADAPHGGCACFYRRKDAPESTMTFRLHNIDEASTYRIEDQHGVIQTISGTELSRYRVSLEEKRSVKFIFYTRLDM